MFFLFFLVFFFWFCFFWFWFFGFRRRPYQLRRRFEAHWLPNGLLNEPLRVPYSILALSGDSYLHSSIQQSRFMTSFRAEECGQDGSLTFDEACGQINGMKLARMEISPRRVHKYYSYN